MTCQSLHMHQNLLLVLPKVVLTWKKKKILQYILALLVLDRFAACSQSVSFKSCSFPCGWSCHYLSGRGGCSNGMWSCLRWQSLMHSQLSLMALSSFLGRASSVILWSSRLLSLMPSSSRTFGTSVGASWHP